MKLQTRTADDLLAGSSGICPSASLRDGKYTYGLVQISFPGPVRVTAADARKLAIRLLEVADRADEIAREAQAAGRARCETPLRAAA